MGYYTHLYAVDLQELRGFCATPGEDALAALFQSKNSEIEDNDDRFESEIDEDWPMTADAIAEIMTGNCVPGDHASMYGYALEIICSHFGEYLNNDELGSLRYQLYESKLLETRSPVPMPLSDNFPSIGYLEANEVGIELEQLVSAGLPSDEEVAEDAEVLRNSLERALEGKVGVISFYY